MAGPREVGPALTWVLLQRRDQGVREVREPQWLNCNTQATRLLLGFRAYKPNGLFQRTSAEDCLDDLGVELRPGAANKLSPNLVYR